MRDCDTCTHKGEGVMGDHCGRCVIQEQTPTQYESKDSYPMTWELAAHNVADHIRELERENAELKKALGAGCESCRWMNEDETGPHCQNCVHNAKDNYQPMSNHDRLRTMTARELAQWLDQSRLCLGEECPEHDIPSDCEDCADRIEEWLSQPVENQRSERNAAL
jgi:hypothetical protein